MLAVPHRTNSTASRPVSSGSSPKVSLLRPHRGSRTRLMLGAKALVARGPCPLDSAALLAPRSSEPMAAATLRTRRRSKLAARAMGCGGVKGGGQQEGGRYAAGRQPQQERVR